MVKFNLTYEHMAGLPGLKELWNVHTQASSNLEKIFKDSSLNNYAAAAKAAMEYVGAAATADQMIGNMAAQAFNQVKKAEDAYYATDMKGVKVFRDLGQIESWASYIAEANEDMAIKLLQENTTVRKAVSQYMELYSKEDTPEVHEIYLRSFEDKFENELADAKIMQNVLPILKESFESTLQEQFKLESNINYEESKKVLESRVA